MKQLVSVILISVLAGCAGESTAGGPAASLYPATAGARTHARLAYTLLYSFDGVDDGRDPHAGPFIKIKDTLYGTTAYGGGVCPERCYGGTVFSITTSGTESILHSFETSSKEDGKNPRSGLAEVAGALYGTTVGGGAASCYCGTVFKVSLSGTESVLHSFSGEPDGFGPEYGLLNFGGTLYGTTAGGGTSNDGTVFSITTSGTETVLHSFSDVPDGAHPKSSLIDVGGVLYGTTANGGANGDGAVFTITPSGTETVIYSFKGGKTDGRYPTQAPLLDVDGTLYGTTKYGGAHNRGTIFSITASGTESLVYSFGTAGDGIYPYGGLIDVGGTLYGVTSNGGTVHCGIRYGDIPGCGTVFESTTSGAETVLHSFGGTGDGTYPYSGLIDVAGTLYGTTTAGGTKNHGTVFSIAP